MNINYEYMMFCPKCGSVFYPNSDIDRCAQCNTQLFQSKVLKIVDYPVVNSTMSNDLISQLTTRKKNARRKHFESEILPLGIFQQSLPAAQLNLKYMYNNVYIDDCMAFCPKCARIVYGSIRFEKTCECDPMSQTQYITSKLVKESEFKSAHKEFFDLGFHNVDLNHRYLKLKQLIYEREIIPLGQLRPWTYEYKCNYYDIYGGKYGGKDPITGKKLIQPTDPKPVLNAPKCPICGSTHLKKISTANKVGSVALFGLLAAGHVSKTWKCENCGSKF